MTTRSRFFASTALLINCLIVAGCAAPRATRSADQTDLVQLTSFWQPSLLYLLSSPHDRLYVEVDAVEGCQPSEATLNKLRNFLASYCNKPGGIEIVRSDVIPIKSAQGITRKALASKFLDGPPENAARSSPAFMYVLFYDGALCDRPAIAATGEAVANVAPRGSERNMNPHVDFLPYPSIIFMNVGYKRHVSHDEMLLHEAGHLLGLAGRPTNASDYHCLNTRCLMNHTIRWHVARFLTGRDPIVQRRPCGWCVAQLAESARQPSPANLHFIGPVLVRTEAGYHVLSLPSHVKVIVGSGVTEQDCRDYVTTMRAETRPPEVDPDALRYEGTLRNESEHPDLVKLRDILGRLQADPYRPVRNMAAGLEERIKSE